MAFSTRIDVWVLALALVAGSAWADDPARARTLALEAKKAYDTNDFATAIARYEEAYRLKPAPGILFNLAQSHRRAAHFELALSYFRRYLETNPPQVQAAAVEKLIADTEAEAQAAAERAAAEARRTEEESAEARRLELERTRLARATAEGDAEQRRLEVEREQRAQRELELQRALSEQLKAEAEKKPLVTRWWFWTIVGVVAVGAAATTATVVATSNAPTPTTFPDIDAR